MPIQTLPAYEPYRDGIIRAGSEELIVVPKPGDPIFGPMDTSGHLPDKLRREQQPLTEYGSVDTYNTRPLSPLGKNFAEYFAKRGALKHLEAGQGAGHACFDIHKIAQKAGVTADIHALGLTPVNPSMPVTKDSKRLLRSLQAFAASVQDQIRTLIEEAMQENKIPLDLLLTLKDRVRAFPTQEAIYVDKQYIGPFNDFLEAGQLPQGFFDLIHDDRGVIEYSDDNYQTVNRLLSLLNNEGVLVCAGIGLHNLKEGRQDSNYDPYMCMLPMKITMSSRCLFFHRESEIAKRLLPALTEVQTALHERDQVPTGFFRMDENSLEAFLDEHLFDVAEA